MGRTDGDNYTLDDMFVSSAAQKERAGRDEERQRNKAVHETRRLAGRMEKCPHCFDSPELPKHLIAAVGTKALYFNFTIIFTLDIRLDESAWAMIMPSQFKAAIHSFVGQI